MHTPPLLLRARVVAPVVRPPLENGAVLVADGRIRSIGAYADLRREHPGATVQDLGGSILLPGLINAHCHLDYTHMAGGIPPQKTFADWIKAILAHKAAWSYTDFAASWVAGAGMLLRNGVTTVLDIESVPELLGEAWSATPLRVVSAMEMTGVRSGKPPEQIVSEAVSAFPATTDQTKSPALSPHALYSAPAGLFPLAAATAAERNWPITSHVAESMEEFELFTNRSGALYDWLGPQRDWSMLAGSSPVAFLDRLGVLSSRFIAVHVNCLADGDAGCLSARNVSVVHCPRSHAYFRHPAFPYAELTAAGVNVCLGTDSLASIRGTRRAGIELCLFREMQKFSDTFPGVTSHGIVRMATTNPAQALRRKGEIGELTPGAAADLVAIPISPGCSSEAEIYEAIVGHCGPVSGSMIGGRWLFQPA